MVNPSESIAQYQDALEHLEAAVLKRGGREKVSCQQELLQVLLARDELARSIADQRPMDAATMGRIIELDGKLRDHAGKISAVVAPSIFADCRASVRPPEGSWWWFLDSQEQEDRGKLSTFLLILTSAFVVVAISLITDLSHRFLCGEGDWLDIANAVVQPVLTGLGAVLTLLAGASLTGPGHELFEKAASRLRLFKGYGSKRKVIVAGILLLVVVGVRLSLGKFALSAYNQGLTYQDSNDLTRATESYRRALCLVPRYSPAHYELATILEKTQPKDAIKEYGLAIQYDSQFYPAYNNLARLLIMQKDDNGYASALQLLNQAKNLEPLDPRVQYSLYKNLGWASLKRKHYAESEGYLRRAISLRKPDEGAAAHCLLASLLKELNDRHAIAECETCISLEPGEPDVDDESKSDAKECLLKGGSKR
jgi:tetratricopeptide (TPR) repeat protein